MRMDEHWYVPRLLVKQGEMNALSGMNPTESEIARGKATLCPLLEIPEIEWNFKENRPKARPIEFINKKCDLIRKSWSLPAFLDAAAVTRQKVSAEPAALIDSAFSALGKNSGMIPVLHDLEITSKAYRQVHSLIINKSCSEVCLRFQKRKWLELINKDRFNSWLQGLGISQRECHVIIDLESDVDENSCKAVASALSNMIPGLYAELDFVILGTAVPQKLAVGMNEEPRSEWNNWCSMITELGRGPIAFGDYGTVGLTVPNDTDPRMTSISGKFKYTLNDSWLIGKKGLFRGPKSSGGKVIKPTLSAIAEDPRFCHDHCSADYWIEGVSAGTTSSYGSPTTWIKESMVHHMTLVLEQVSAI